MRGQGATACLEELSAELQFGLRCGSIVKGAMGLLYRAREFKDRYRWYFEGFACLEKSVRSPLGLYRLYVNIWFHDMKGVSLVLGCQSDAFLLALEDDGFLLLLIALD